MYILTGQWIILWFQHAGVKSVSRPTSVKWLSNHSPSLTRYVISNSVLFSLLWYDTLEVWLWLVPLLLLLLLVGVWLWADVLWRPWNVPSFLSSEMGNQIRSDNSLSHNTSTRHRMCGKVHQTSFCCSMLVVIMLAHAAVPDFLSKVHSAALRKKKDQCINQLQKNMAWLNPLQTLRTWLPSFCVKKVILLLYSSIYFNNCLCHV